MEMAGCKSELIIRDIDPQIEKEDKMVFASI